METTMRLNPQLLFRILRPWAHVGLLALFLTPGCDSDLEDGFDFVAIVSAGVTATPPADTMLDLFLINPTHGSPYRSYALKLQIFASAADVVVERVTLATADADVSTLFEGSASANEIGAMRFDTDIALLMRDDLDLVVEATINGTRLVDRKVFERRFTGSSIQVTAAVHDNDGTTWLATVSNGLVARRVVERDLYPGVMSVDPYDAGYQGPQSNLVLDVAANDGDIWVATATTGISRRDGATGGWQHFQPPTDDINDDTLINLRETAIALHPFAGGIWVGTLDGLYLFTLNPDPTWTRVADGVVLTMGGDDDQLWVGFAAPAPEAVRESGLAMWSQASSTLLHVSFDASLENLQTTSVTGLGSVTALSSDADGAWVGTPDGLFRVSGDLTVMASSAAATLSSSLAVTALDRSTDGTLWVGTRNECELGQGRLLRLTVDGDAAIVDVEDLTTLRGLVGRDFGSISLVGAQTAIVSTSALVPLTEAPFTASGCEVPDLASQPGGAHFVELGPDAFAVRFH
ncbi:MAG: hypothetical protein ACI9MR_003223 [Myxococcota bacterium]|jgi:hypothetical protein